MNNYIYKAVKDPYVMNKNISEKIFLYDKQYFIKLELTGDFGNKKIYCTIGETDNKEKTNYFIFTKCEVDDFSSKLEKMLKNKITEFHTECITQTIGYFDVEVANDIENTVKIHTGYRDSNSYDVDVFMRFGDFVPVISALNKISSAIITDFSMKKYEDSLINELHTYIDRGYVKEVVLERLNRKVTGFDPVVYKTFKISIVPSHDVPPDAGVNLAFAFIKCLHLDINEDKYNETINSLINNNKNVKVTFINYDRKKEISNYIKNAKKELKDYDFTKRKAPSKEDISKARDILLKLGIIKK